MSLKKCSRCKKDFDCRSEAGGCWCEGVKLDSSTNLFLQKEYDNCLCKDCLTYFEKRIKENNVSK